MDRGEIRDIVEDTAKNNVVCKGVDGPNRGLAYGLFE